MPCFRAVLGTLAILGTTVAARAEEGGTGHYLPGSMSSFLDASPTSGASVLLAATPHVCLAQGSVMSKAVRTAENMEPALSFPEQDKAAADMLTALASKTGKKPNIVWLIIDDMGYGDPGCYGGGAVVGAATPNMDRLAREGLKLTSCYSHRAIYKDGWVACAFGPLYPWNTAASVPRIAKWDSATDEWELYHVAEDFSQADDLAKHNSAKLDELKKEFLAIAGENKDFPIGAGNWLRLYPEDRIKTAYRSWTFNANTRRMPEFAAPGVGRESNKVVIDLEVKDNASGVIYALGGAGGGLTLYMDKGHLVYLYNMMIIEQYTARSEAPLSAGRHRIEVVTDIAGPARPGVVTLIVDGKQVGEADLKRTVPAASSASETFDVGVDLGSTVSLDYAERRPFAFDGTIKKVIVELK